jgi:hypothetical protein
MIARSDHRFNGLMSFQEVFEGPEAQRRSRAGSLPILL